jgi:hypothetical protein
MELKQSRMTAAGKNMIGEFSSAGFTHPAALDQFQKQGGVERPPGSIPI